MGCSGTELGPEGASSVDAGVQVSSNEANEVVSVRKAPLVGSCDPAAPTPPPLPNPHGNCYRLYRSVGDARHLDAYTSGDRNAVLRTRQTDGSQTWCFSANGSDGEYTKYRLRHQTSSGRYLDAATSSSADFGAYTKSTSDNDGSQDWVLVPECGLARFKQFSSGRYLDGYTTQADDYRVVTRGSQSDDSQLWWFGSPQ